MKKILLSIICALSIMMLSPIVKADEKVKVYMFTKDGCPACISAHEFFDELESEHGDLFEVVEIEVFDKDWKANSEELQNLLIDTYEYFGENTEQVATPTIVIGDYHTVGLPQETDEIIKKIKDFSKDEKRKDVVQELAENLKINLSDLNNKKPVEEDKGSTTEVLIVIGIFVVIIGGFAGLLIAGQKK